MSRGEKLDLGQEEALCTAWTHQEMYGIKYTSS